MKIAFLRPNMGGKRSNDAIEPLAFAVLSGLTDKTKHELMLFDDRIEDIPMDLEVDLIVISTFTMTARRAYELARNYRERGVYVMIEGITLRLCLMKCRNMQIQFVWEVEKLLGMNF